MKAYTTVGFIVAVLVYLGCCLEGGAEGVVLGWIPALILGAIWPLPVAAAIIFGFMVANTH